MSNIPVKGISSIGSVQSIQQGAFSQQQNVQSSMEFNHQTFQTWIDILADSNSNEETKLKAVQDLSLNLELMQTIPTYTQLIDDAMQKFMRVLTETEPQYISESTIQQLRKKILEIIQRNTSILNSLYLNSEKRSIMIREILLLVYRLVEKENEDNVIICLKIITDYHRILKSILNNEVQQFFNFVKSVYRELPRNMSIIFNYKPQIKVSDISEIDLNSLLNETYSSFQIVTEKSNTKDNQTYNVLPRGCMSLKVLSECPLTTVMMYQYNKNYLNQEISEIIPLVANVIALQPTDEQRLSLNNKEIYADFVTAQVKALSFLAFFKSHKDCLVNNSEMVVAGILQLLKNCPPEVVSVRKDLLAIKFQQNSNFSMIKLPILISFIALLTSANSLSLEKRKWSTANVMGQSIGKGATFSGQANAMSGSWSGMSADCNSKGQCVNKLGKRNEEKKKPAKLTISKSNFTMPNLPMLNFTMPKFMMNTKVDLTNNPCSDKGKSGNTCNVNAEQINGGTFVGKRDVKDKRQWYGNTANVNAQVISNGNFVGKRDVKEKRQLYKGNTANVNAQNIGGGTFVGKRDVKDKRQWFGNTANVNAQNIGGGSFVGKRDVKEKRQWFGNTANVNAQNIGGGNFIGKRDAKEKRQWSGNTANVNSKFISGGNFIGKRDI